MTDANLEGVFASPLPATEEIHVCCAAAAGGEAVARIENEEDAV